jgi:hypothetical protein
MKEMRLLRDLRHDNINSFIGIYWSIVLKENRYFWREFFTFFSALN